RSRRTEPAGDETDRAAGGEVTHLHEVLLAGQSKPVPDRGEQVPARQRTEIHRAPGARVGQHDAPQRDGNVDLTGHGRLDR
ncbi:MAG: hypothetical protein WBR33_22875, partial [Pseudonocardiaceae bacterium]